MGVGTENANNKASVFLHTADTYVVANDSVKYQGKSSLGRPEAQFPPERVITLTVLPEARLAVEKGDLTLLLASGG